MSGQEQRRQGQDDREAGKDEADSTDDGSEAAPETPSAVDRQLGGCGAREEVGSGDAVLELVGSQPLTLLDAELAEQCNVGGWTAKSDGANASPLADDGPERDRLAQGLGHGSGNRMARTVADEDALPPAINVPKCHTHPAS